ncbi:MAG: hypothetical protein H6738_14280 [Alphaproteobacteria bacterium]|nr:hypothetical protein [Alphaproteobacteria bacterium]MCB9697942.1 hypothetical protein [Alphaproteobacteria bacterium]
MLLSIIAARAAPIDRSAAQLGVPFDEHHVTDALGREITWYLSQPPATGSPLPLALWIDGSGAQSVFDVRGGHPTTGFPGVLLRRLDGRARLLVVEKPGVSFGQHPDVYGTAMGASPMFQEEHTLPRWVEANRAALDAALAREDIDASTVLAIGHSEGGAVVCHLAAVEPRIHAVASLSGGGPSQLFDLITMAWAPGRRHEPLERRQARVDEIWAAWTDIVAHPDADTMWWGHPYRRWASFLSTSPLEGLRATDARVYVAAGTEDRAVPIASPDLLVTELVRDGRDTTYERRAGDDHGFAGKGHGAVEGMGEVFDHVVAWWLGSDHTSTP